MTRVRTAYWRALSEERRKDPAYREKQRGWYASWRERNPVDDAERARKAEQMRIYARAHGTREHHRARWLVHRALKAGRLTRQPCEVCGVMRVHAHHDDYAQPLSVRWLCPTHHREYHAKATAQ